MTNEVFVENVAEGRSMSLDAARALATGLPFTGEQAIENGLADEVGVFDDAIEAAAQLADLGSDYNVITLAQSSDLGSLMDLLSESDSDSATSAAAAKLIELLKNEGFFRELYQRTNLPARAVVTAGMPYGNKKLHFGHVAGVFVPADAYARFLRDRIGEQNVLFVSGTDCYGSPIQEGYRKACENEGFDGTIVDYVQRNHDAQKATLDAYDISLSIYEGSGIGRAGEVHQRVTNDLLEKLHENGHLRLMETLQFYDPEAGQFLNGRQVHGYCPVQGCKSGEGLCRRMRPGPPVRPCRPYQAHVVAHGLRARASSRAQLVFRLAEFPRTAWRDCRKPRGRPRGASRGVADGQGIPRAARHLYKK